MSDEAFSASQGFKVFPEGEKVHLVYGDGRTLCGCDWRRPNAGTLIYSDNINDSTVVNDVDAVCDTCLEIPFNEEE
jgi:hypothetical protein